VSAAAAEDKKAESDNGAPPPPLPPWQESFIARYPRKLKIAAALVGLLILVSPLFIHIPESLKSKTQTITHVEGADSKSTANKNAAETAAEVGADTTHIGNNIVNDQDDRSVKLSQAPDMALSEDTSEGSLPRIGEDGRQPWQVYARPFNTADQRPRIAIVLVDLGLSRVATDAAISRMPANVTLAFDVQSPVVGAWCARARQDGHETLLMVPMEPFDYPRSDPGANTLLTTLPNTDNLTRFNASLRQATGYVGVTTLSGSRFTTDPDKLGTVLDVLHKRGLMIFDARVAPHSAIMDMARNMHVAAVASTTRIDQNPSPEAIDQALDQLEKTARLTGRAVGVASALPVVLDRLQYWTKDLPSRGVALAPISAMVQ
jgi:polysaccharide deacetylase 2 family uncharacterized protein YibQ